VFENDPFGKFLFYLMLTLFGLAGVCKIVAGVMVLSGGCAP
jgi:hypothetical protein